MKKHILIILILASFLFFLKLGSFSLYDAAETTYGEFIKQIRLTGDWVTMHYNGEIIFDKPPLYFWLATLATYIFGFNEFAIRFWAALAGVLTALTTYLLARLFYNEKIGFLAALVTITSLQILVQSRIAEIDILLTFFITASFLLFFLGYQTKKAWYFWLFYLCLGLATLTKGIIGVALPAFSIFLFLVFKKDLKAVRQIQLFPGIIIFSLVAPPWYLIEWLLHGQKFAEFVFGFLFLSRFGKVVSGHTGPWYYYFISLLLGFAPWSSYLPIALYQTWENKHKQFELLSLCYITPTFIVFSLAKTKLPNYLLPLFPFLAIMVAKTWFGALFEKQGKNMLFSQIFLSLVILLLMIAATIAGQQYSGPYQEMLPHLYFLAGILLAGVLFSTFFFLRKHYSFSFASLVIMVFTFALYLIIFALPAVENYKGMKELSQKVAKAVRPNDSIAAYNLGNRPSVVFYNVKPIIFLDDKKELLSFLSQSKGYCFTTVEEYSKLKRFARLFLQKADLVVIH